MRDLIIVLPGIMGSVLRRDGTDVWDPGLGMARRLLRSRQWVDSLTLIEEDDPANLESIDGIVPVGLARSTAVIPGLVEIDGYTELHDALVDAFGSDLIEGDPLTAGARLDCKDPAINGCPNYYRFAYDWRRDLRASALRLHHLIEHALPNLRAQRSPDAKVIFVAHSMGGLLARAYIEGVNPETGEPFDGWRNVRELFTMGTPYRGAVVATSHLVDGFKKLFIDLSRALRSFTGVYQLLPRYRAVQDRRAGSASSSWIYPHEMNDVSDFSVTRARAAYDFHLSIEEGVERNRSISDYPRAYCVPLLGFGHSTVNSAILTDDGLTVSNDLPDYLGRQLGGGDGTVPLVSAIPLEYDGQRSALRYVNQQHGALQTDRRVLAAEIANRIRQLQAGTEAARGPGGGGASGGDAGDGALPSLNIDHLNFWVEGDSDGTVGGARNLGGVAPQQLQLTIDGVSNALGTVTVTNLETGAAEKTENVESGQVIALPAAAGDYRVVAVCPAAQLSSASQFSVLPADDPGQEEEPG